MTPAMIQRMRDVRKEGKGKGKREIRDAVCE